jgi:ATP-dependent exoDNAse (exonuclease V) alpha subunit
MQNLQLSNQQQRALSEAMDPSYGVVILTGPAGTGKSTIIKELAERGSVTVCATTGKAALNIEGVTVDKLFGIDREKWRLFNPNYTLSCMGRAKQTILIDEASMIGARMAELIYSTAVKYKKRIILVGDWGQAAPVLDDWAFDSPLFTNAHVIKLTECHRQSAGAYLESLNKVRCDNIDASVHDLFKGVSDAQIPGDDFPGICLFGTNAKTDRFNHQCLQSHLSLSGNWAAKMHTSVDDMRTNEKKDEKPLTENMLNRLIEDSCLGHGENIAIGCKVVCTRNSNMGTYVNGTIGFVEDIFLFDGRSIRQAQEDMRLADDDVPVSVDIRTPDNKIVRVSMKEMPVKNAMGRVEYMVRGLPLRLGYGLTIHKSQGMTVDNTWFDMRSLEHFPVGSRHGLAYVALSRTRTLEGLRIGSWAPETIECNSLVKKWL